MRKMVVWVCCAMIVSMVLSGGIAMSEAQVPAQTAPLRIMYGTDPRALPPEEMLFNQNMYEKTGIEIEWMPVAGDAYDEKRNLLFAANELPDIFFGGLQRKDILMYKDQGAFVVLNDYVDTAMPNFKAVLDKRPEYRAMITVPEDGNIYGLPYIEEMYGLILNQGILQINKVWLAELGLSMPTTSDEFVEVLRAFRDKDPNGNGIADEIPFSYTHGGCWSKKSEIGSWRNNGDIGQFMGMFGMADRGDCMALVDGKVVSTATTDAYKDGVKFFNSLYEEDLIDPDFSTGNRALLEAKLNEETPILGAFMTFAIADNCSAERREMYEAVPYLKGPNGEFGCRENLSEMHNAVAGVITSACTQIDLAVYYCDLYYDPVTSVESNWGPVGYQYVLNDQGVMVFGELRDGCDNYDQMRFRHTLGGNRAGLAILTDYYDTVVEYPQNALDLLNDMRKVGFVDKNLDTPYVPPLWYTTDQSDRMAQLSPQVYGYIDSMRAKWVTDGNVDDEWDDYVQRLDELGWSEFLGIVQDAYDSYAANLN